MQKISPTKIVQILYLQKHQENSRNIHVSGEKRRKEKSELRDWIFELDHIYWFKTLLMSISRINWSKKQS